MEALLFLTTRSFTNAIKRAVTSGRRIFTLIFAIAYYTFLVFRPMGSHASTPLSARPLSADIIDVGLFGFYGIIALLLTMTLLAPRAGFRQPDVDVLFATPVDPKLVMVQRILRDYLITLLSPLLLCLMGGSAALRLIQRFLMGAHGNSALVERSVGAAWLLMALAWVCLSYGINASINRSDLNADRNKKILNWLILGAIVGVGTMFFIQYRHDASSGTVIAWAQSPAVRSVFFTATAATWIVKGALYSDYGMLAGGIAALLACIGAGVYLSLSQLPYMYDQAAVKGFGSTELRTMRRNNDFYGLMARQAQEGKLKTGRLSRWIGRMRMSGAYALVWKEVLLQLRGARYLYVFFGPLQLFTVVFPVVAIPHVGSHRGFLLFIMQGVGVMTLTMNTAISGFIELLKRVDFQKPLPFRPAGTVFWEIASKCIPTLIFGSLASLICVIVVPSLIWYGLASIPLVLGTSLLISAIVFLVTISFPDAGDASQRSFRGILILIGMVILGSPGAGALIFLTNVMHVHPLLAVIPPVVIDVALTLGVSYFAGRLYESYNPSE